MNKPTSVTLYGGIRFSVKYVYDLRDDDGSPLWGTCDGSSRTIHICSKRNDTPAKLRQTAFHELLHGALYLSGHTETLETNQEEALVLAIESALGKYFRFA